MLVFEWDLEKNNLNIQNHGISFETASLVFEDPNYVEMYDFEHSSDEEDRFVALGLVGKVLFVVFTERRERVRIISARLATKSERSFYYENLRN